MTPARVAVVIPARFGAQRFPGKPLAPIAGKPMIAHVATRVRGCPGLDAVIVATDDERIAAAAREAGAEVAMTGEAATGSDRVALVARQRPEFDIIVNVQGDEPLIAPAVVAAVVAPLAADATLPVATAARPLFADEDVHDANLVKVVTNVRGDALYFSRAAIPHVRGEPLAPRIHVGIYGYRRAALLDFARTPATPLERAEMLEQLRLVEHGVPIRVVAVSWRGVAVDRPADIGLVEARLRDEGHGIL